MNMHIAALIVAFVTATVVLRVPSRLAGRAHVRRLIDLRDAQHLSSTRPVRSTR